MSILMSVKKSLTASMVNVSTKVAHTSVNVQKDLATTPQELVA